MMHLPAIHTQRSDMAFHLPPESANHWDEVLSAVKLRLSLTAGELGTVVPPSPMPATAQRFRASLLECVEALDALQFQLDEQIRRSNQLERDVVEARGALQQARVELAGTHAGARKAQHSALHDSLTQLPNRQYFLDKLNAALQALVVPGEAVTVLYLDLDGFKAVNDTHGHAVGDELLRVVAARLNQAVRVEDLVCRLGGDEFACMLSGRANQTQLSQLACKLFDSVAAACRIGSHEITVRPSIGIAVSPKNGATSEGLIQNADAAMYRAKKLQLGYAFFDANDKAAT